MYLEFSFWSDPNPGEPSTCHSDTTTLLVYGASLDYKLFLGTSREAWE